MKIISTFTICKETLYAVQFEDSDNNEFELAFDNWNDVEYLEGFFEENRKDLESGFYGDISIEEAIEITIKEAEELEDNMRIIALGKNQGLSLQTLFRPLHNQDYRQSNHQKNKATGGQHKSWLRIYAIKVGDLYVICGSAIKLTPDMKENSHLQKQLRKLEMTKNYLIENGVLDGDDFEFLEF